MPNPTTSPAQRVLVIDDDEYVYAAISAALRRLSADVVGARSAAQGLATARESMPHLVIVDVGLPDQNGYELTRALRADDRLASTRILIMTGHLPDETAAHAAGADAIMGKPFRLREFLEIVSGLLADREDAGGSPSDPRVGDPPVGDPRAPALRDAGVARTARSGRSREPQRPSRAG